MDNKGHQGSKRSHDQTMTSDNNKHQEVKEPAPKRHKDDSGRPSSSSSTSARDNRATSSSTMPRRLSQGPPVTFSGPPQSTALRAIEEMQGIRRDTGNASASGGPGRASRHPSEPVQAKPGTAPERKVYASSSGPDRTGRQPGEPAKDKFGAPEREAPTSSTSGPSILRRNSASGLIPPKHQVKSVPVVANRSGSEVARTNRPESSAAKSGASSRPEWSTAKSSGPPLNREGSNQVRDRSKEVRLSSYDVLKATGAEEKYLSEAKRRERPSKNERREQGRPSSSSSAKGPAAAASASSAAGPAASAPTASGNAEDDAVEVPRRQPSEALEDFRARQHAYYDKPPPPLEKRRPDETMADFLTRKERYYSIYKKDDKQKKPERSVKGKNKSGRASGSKAGNDKGTGPAVMPTAANIAQMNRDRDPTSCIEFPAELFDALAQFNRSVYEEHDETQLQQGYAPSPVYVLVLEQNRPGKAYFSVCGTAQGMGPANQLALSLFRQEVPRVLPELRDAAGMAHEDWKESLAQLQKDHPDTKWTKKFWYKATGDLRGSARLAWYVDRDGDNKGLVTLSATLPVHDEKEPQYQMTVKVLRHKKILLT
ncbi:uncharacterized protein PG986_005166 [Apiospora aurea]|uniref:Uncharacterized protein n=1 Tax=Apiospora aurea TaxID=335848 RepID=A0ABR1QGR8_9PEZI